MRDGSVWAPSAGFWVGHEVLSDPIRLYGSVARRHEDHSSMLAAGQPEYKQLLCALDTIPALHTLGDHVREARTLVRK